MAVVRTPERFGFAADAAVAAEIDRAIAQGARGVVFDLTDTMMLSSAGIRLIVQTAGRPELKPEMKSGLPPGMKAGSGIRVRAAGLDPQIFEVLKLVRIDSLVPAHPTVEAAVAACRAAGA